MESWTDADEHRHADVAVEAWWWWGSGTWLDADGEPCRAGLFVGFELHGRSFDYWAGLVRAGAPYLYVEELRGTGLRAGLEVKPAEMWADHSCDVPFRQWSLGNEAHGVLLDDATEAWRRAYGDPTPVTFDVEWHSSGTPTALAGLPMGAGGYEQRGEIDAEIELVEGVLALTGAAHRVHVWGVPHVPRSLAMPIDAHGLRAPYRRRDGILVDQVLTDAGWWVSVSHGGDA